MNEHARLIANYRRAVTVHTREQAKGRHDMSVRQTRRMALAVAAMQRAYGALDRFERSNRITSTSGA